MWCAQGAVCSSVGCMRHPLQSACLLPPQGEASDDDDFVGGLDALRSHVLAFPKERKLGAMDRDMDDDNLVVRP